MSIEMTNIMMFTISLKMALDLDRKEAQGLFDLVEDYLEEKYPKIYKEDFRPAGVKITIRTEGFEKRNTLKYVTTPDQAAEILDLVKKHLKPVREANVEIENLFQSDDEPGSGKTESVNTQETPLQQDTETTASKSCQCFSLLTALFVIVILHTTM